MPKSREIYRNFHGRRPDKIERTVIDYPTELVFLGRAIDIGYESDKLNGCPPEVAGKMNRFRHKMPKANKVYGSANGGILIIVGPNIKITERGIEN